MAYLPAAINDEGPGLPFNAPGYPDIVVFVAVNVNKGKAFPVLLFHHGNTAELVNANCAVLWCTEDNDERLLLCDHVRDAPAVEVDPGIHRRHLAPVLSSLEHAVLAVRHCVTDLEFGSHTILAARNQEHGQDKQGSAPERLLHE